LRLACHLAVLFDQMSCSNFILLILLKFPVC
jgi:hypothetical protein